MGGKPCSFIIIDIDDFKGINDTYGHPMGDRVLVALARHLRSTVRSGDVVARFGGDEFVVFARGLPAGKALEGLVARLTQNTFTGRRSDDPGLGIPLPSVSIGAVTSPDGSAGFEELYAAADKALYQAKTGGKNRLQLTCI
ncbi:GGDEF domain-containing protein [Kribbibacterium absianum]|uniref:GGDEF domain-containing protein n=1 Tax=Kribbibacterium absianum TaxID=3044210 RepID=UPI0024BD2E54|nr:GGDEF domain-containing protein [Olsenella sp. YH-ols2216]MDJ1122686.1 GGDEF domain-containing protein [Olsenella sp. YH-ols2216]